MKAEMIIAIITGVLAGPMLAIFVTPIFVLVKNMFYTPLMQNRYLRKAVDKGHVVEARFESSHDIYSHQNGDHSYTGRERGSYVYEWKGKKYKYSAVTRNRLPETISLYFLKNPRKASPQDMIGYKEVGWFKCYLMSSLIMMVVAGMVAIKLFGI